MASKTDQERVACSYCDKTFATLTSRKVHLRKFHQIDLRRRGTMSCLECPKTFTQRVYLVKHLYAVHGMTMEKIIFQFPSFADFEKWLEIEERQTTSKFIKPWGQKQTQNGTVFTYLCCRDGAVTRPSYVQEKDRKRAQKSQGPRKCGHTCTSHLVVNTLVTPKACVVVQYYKTHYGHGKEVDILFLTRSEKERIAGQLALGMTDEEIIEDALRSSNESLPSRMDSLSKKDISNVRRAYGIAASTDRTNQQIKNDHSYLESESDKAEVKMTDEIQGLVSCLTSNVHRLESLPEASREKILRYLKAVCSLMRIPQDKAEEETAEQLENDNDTITAPNNPLKKIKTLRPQGHKVEKNEYQRRKKQEAPLPNAEIVVDDNGEAFLRGCGLLLDTFDHEEVIS